MKPVIILNPPKILRLGVKDNYYNSDKVKIEGYFGGNKNLFQRNNGLLFGAIEAYNNHHNMTFDPTKVWLTILSQYNFFHQRYAEQLRKLYVNHEGQQEIKLFLAGDINTFDDDDMLNKFSDAISGNIKDGEFTNWVIPNFTTTQPIDVLTSKAMLMSVLQKYFDYKVYLKCGIPEYIILGEKDDWLKLSEKLTFFIGNS